MKENGIPSCRNLHYACFLWLLFWKNDKSKEKQDDICNVLQEWESILTENITEEERNTLINILKKICLNKNKKIGGLNE